MSITSELLFAYLREIFYSAPDAKLDVDRLEEDYHMFGKGLMYFAHCFYQYNEFAKALARGDLGMVPPPPENELAAPLKSLHASLKHLTWQSKQVAQGDYKQHVDFMGEFAEGFNTMVAQLADRQQKLENEISLGQKHATALEQSNLLLSKLTQYIPQQIFVVAINSREILLDNDLAKKEMDRDPQYIHKLMNLLPRHRNRSDRSYNIIQIDQEDGERYLAVNSYFLEWSKTNAVALIISDVSAEKKQMRELENQAYRDFLTNVYNRFYGMIALNEWLEKRKQFALVFVDLDNLKYVNDAHGHSEGDEYIIRVARHLASMPGDIMLCRIGGDEFMLLIPDTDHNEVRRKMTEISTMIENDEYLLDKDYHYSISFGIVTIHEDNRLPSSSILSIADERMYEHKRARKKERQASS